MQRGEYELTKKGDGKLEKTSWLEVKIESWRVGGL
jgi:hypothetical protein